MREWEESGGLQPSVENGQERQKLEFGITKAVKSQEEKKQLFFFLKQ